MYKTSNITFTMKLRSLDAHTKRLLDKMSPNKTSPKQNFKGLIDTDISVAVNKK